MNEVNIEYVDEVSEIKMSKKKSKEEKNLDFVDRTKNPYVFKVNGRLVRMSFLENGPTMDDCLTRVLENLYR